MTVQPRDKRTIALALVLAGAAAFGGCSLDGSAAHPDLPPGAAPASGARGVAGSGGSNDPGAGGTPSDCIEPACLDLPLPPSAHAVRLMHDQWESSVRDLLALGVAPGLSSRFPADPAPPKDQFGVDAGSLQLSEDLWREYQRAAEDVATLVTGDPARLDAILPAAAKTGDTAARIQAFLTAFLPRAYRRPVTQAEIDAAAAFADAMDVAASDGGLDTFTLRVKWAIAFALQSPYFLYRVEGGEGPVVDGRARLGSYELASKLSYALWRTMPDDALIARAASGELATNAGVAAVARDMLADARAETTLTAFHDLLFLLDQFTGVVRQTSLFPKWYPEFGRDAQEDVRRTIRDLVIDHPGGVKELYTSTAAYVNAPLAGIYGIDPATVPGLAGAPTSFVRVDMDPTKRLGVLSHVGWLAMEGKAKDPATILRGVYVTRHLLCIPLGSPPPAAAGHDPSEIKADTDRERVAGVTAGCGDGCHGGQGGVINPLGFSFEEFDSLGQLRTEDNHHPIDAKGTIDALGSFDGAAAMLSKAADSPRAHACYAAHWSAYLNGTTRLDVRQKWLSPIIAKSMKGASVRDLIVELVQTNAFLTVSRE